MRTETEMHDLVVAKVAQHRRRQTLVASAGGGVAVVLLLVAVAAGASGTGPAEDVKAGDGDPTSTTEAPTTTELRTTTTTPPPSSTAPAETTTTSTEVPTTTTEPPATTTEPPTPTTTSTAPPVAPTSTVVTGSDGDLSATFTVTTDTKGWVIVRVQLDDPTGVHDTDGWSNGPWGVIARDEPGGSQGDTAYYGDAVAGCREMSGPPSGVAPASFDDTVTMSPGAGPIRLRLFAATLSCMDGENSVERFVEVVVP